MGFLFDEKYARDFQLFGWLHILVLAIAAASLFALYYFRNRLKNPTAGRVYRYTVAALLVTFESTFQVWMASRQGFRWADFVPLGLCAMMEWITVVTLVFDLKAVSRVVLPWAFVGALLSFIVVNMGASYTFPHFRFFHYFGIHWLFLAGNLFYLFTGAYTYDYRALVRSTYWLGGVSLAVLGIDFAIGQNFMFLREWPDELSFFKPYIPFPLNTLLLMLAAFLLFNLFYLIFVIGRFDGSPRTAPIGDAAEATA
jgi:hypothetical integral membrane protein (TIGR02206 family)